MKSWSFKNVSRLETSAFTHGYHRYPAKFIPNIVRKILRDFTVKNDLVLDPFGGCGTTLVESKRLGRRSICFDINPIAKLITEVKVTAINPLILEGEFNKIKKNLLKGGQKESKLFLNNDRLLYWFDKKTIKELSFIYFEIKKVKNKKIKNFLMCAFSHNLKNSSRWLMKSIKPTIDKNKIISSPSKTYINHLSMMVKKNRKFWDDLLKKNCINISSKIYLKDSTKKFLLDDNKVDLIVTSPPYVTSYEYADLHQLSLIWFGIDKKEFNGWGKSLNNFSEFRRNFIGTSFKIKQEGNIGSLLGFRIVEDLFLIDKSLSKDVANYFIDMNSSFKEMYRVLKTQKYACIIIGNTQLRGIDILNAEVALEQMLNIGFKKYKVIKREVTSKMIAPWRDSVTGKFTSKNNPNKKCAYKYEYILIMQK